MFPILIADDAASWFESGAVQDVTVRNNTFRECGYNSVSGAINIAPENREFVPESSVHRNIRIIDNSFILINAGLLNAKSVSNLVFTGNKISWTSLLSNKVENPSINLNSCRNVLIKKNRFNSIELPLVKTTNMITKDLKTDLKTDF